MSDRDIFWDNVNSLVHDFIQPVVVDAIYSDNPVYATAEANNRVITRGGDVVSWPVMFAKLRSGSYRGMTSFPSQEVTIHKRAVLENKQLFVDIVVSSYDAIRAQGPLAVVDLVDELKQAAVLTANDLAGEHLYADGSGNGGLDLDGARLAADDGTNYASYASITRSGNTWWQGQLNTTGGPLTTAAMNSDYGDCTVGNTHPNLISTTQALWNKLLDRVLPSQRYEAGNPANATAKIGFDALKFLGADVVHDSHVPSGNMFYWNMDQFELRHQDGRMFDWTGWKEPVGQDGKQGQMLYMGNFVYLNPRLFGRSTGVT